MMSFEDAMIQSINRYFDILEGKRQCAYCGEFQPAAQVRRIDDAESMNGVTLICDMCLNGDAAISSCA